MLFNPGSELDVALRHGGYNSRSCYLLWYELRALPPPALGVPEIDALLRARLAMVEVSCVLNN